VDLRSGVEFVDFEPLRDFRVIFVGVEEECPSITGERLLRPLTPRPRLVSIVRGGGNTSVGLVELFESWTPKGEDDLLRPFLFFRSRSSSFSLCFSFPILDPDVILPRTGRIAGLRFFLALPPSSPLSDAVLLLLLPHALGTPMLAELLRDVETSTWFCPVAEDCGAAPNQGLVNGEIS